MQEHPNIHPLHINGKTITLIGTAHVSKDSATLVENVITEEKPDHVCVELCASRYEAIQQKDRWQQTDIVKVIREKRASLLLSQLLMAAFQKRIAKKLQINPGEEMLRAIATAEQVGAEVVLIDRSIRTTLLRTWRRMRLYSKLKFLPELILSPFFSEEISEADIEKLKQHDVLELALQTLGDQLPEVKATLIDERDQYLAHQLAHAPGTKVVAVVGAGHVPGILRYVGQEIDIEALDIIPPKGWWSRSLGWIFSIAVVGLFVAGFFSSGSRASLYMLLWWSVITACCASLGAILLFSHPLTVLAAALSAPIATLHPLIATGWVAGLTEATIRKPQVKDFLSLTEDITTVKGFFRNKITRILLIIAIVNLTTSIGTFAAIPVILRYL